MADPHPLIGLLLSDDERKRLGALDRGLTRLSLSAQLTMDFRKRIVTDNPNGIGDAEAALAELLVAGPLALAGAEVAIVPRSVGGADIRAICGTDSVTVEVARVQRDQGDRRKDNQKRRAFGHWRAGRPAPEEIREHARQFGPARVLEYEVHPLGHGDAADKIERLIEKGKRKVKQLRSKPSPLLVFSLFRREMLFRQEMCRPTYMESVVLGGRTTGPFYAATYGRKDDPIFSGNDFNGRPRATLRQRGNGILHRYRFLAGVMWLFPSLDGVFFENPYPDEVCLSTEGRDLVLRAFNARKAEMVLKSD
ncbi:MAG: hypothetical protein ABSA52_16755 [Candidatus Binatia bacterium]